MASRFQWLRNLFLKNKTMKILAFVLAVMTLHAVRSATNDEDTYIIPIEPMLSDKNMEVVEQDPRSMKVTLRGSREDLKRVDPKYMKAVVRPRPGKDETLVLRPRDIRGVAGLRVVAIDPVTVRFTVITKIEEETPPPSPGDSKDDGGKSIGREWTNVTVMAVGEPGSIKDIVFEPPVVNLSLWGPAPEIEVIGIKPPVVFVDCVGLVLSGAVERPVKVYLSDEKKIVARIQPDRVKVSTGK